MDFSYSEEQQMLQDSISKFVAQDYDFDTRKKIIQTPEGFSTENWKLFADLGWLMVPFGEADGGLGGSATDLMVVMEELGKGIVVEPYLACVVMAGGLVAELGSEQQKQEILGPVMAGERQLAFAFAEAQGRYNLADVGVRAQQQGDDWIVDGHKAVVLNGEAAEQLVVSVRTAGDRTDAAGISLLVIDAGAPGVTRKGYQTVDGQRAAEVTFDRVTVPAGAVLGPVDQALPAIEKVIDRATLAVCAEAVGAMEVTYKKTVEYTKTRKQFGVPLAKFQALQHRMAEMFMEYELARSMLLMAAMQLDASDGLAPKAVSAAKNRIGKAARLIGQEAVQLHGGIGVTEELDIGHYFKRLTTIQFIFGSGDYHLQRYQQ
ncbi:pimeloyl-CoA dehydrogenase small subunit [Exilibacterium tricleocarpae]|uniref:Pimeloyl-CoA dehydrogenase small subunit n=1 Tax=Exilibacterium tricleocarpae TaxID=2591008 RepID=A0A545U3E8_9GAMM|nr:acyl-CoA dehydrogenase family protein [Exilibacterium tricleocarpae]TQV83999.1 pimeloyl-CoA dehydrogenase small subunit [Exilibacterium tricleocarpae]